MIFDAMGCIRVAAVSTAVALQRQAKIAVFSGIIHPGARH
jgi:hypothetical protein